MDLDFDKMNGLVPAIIQDNDTRKVLMLGFMNKEAYEKTVETGKVTFFSRTKNRLWTKGEESGNFLNVVSIKEDCDKDTLLIQVNPVGPVCHTGTDTCWGEKNEEPVMFLKLLQDFIDRRHEEMPEKSYTTSLFQSGINKIAQKVDVREEAVQAVHKLTVDLKNPTKISEVGATEADLEPLAHDAFHDVCTPGNPRQATQEDILAIYKSLM